ncbi:MAG: hypothetical protein GY804_11005 [Alphaproteobacteria bacterium]|nr:hypothetical protein [Alphaproteobacteria bacterium]
MLKNFLNDKPTGDPLNAVATAIAGGTKKEIKKHSDPKTIDLANNIHYFCDIIAGKQGLTRPKTQNPDSTFTPLAEAFGYLGGKLNTQTDEQPQFSRNDKISKIAKELVFLADAFTNDSNNQKLLLDEPIQKALNFVGNVLLYKKGNAIKTPEIIYDDGDAQIAKGIIAVGTFIAQEKKIDVIPCKKQSIEELLFPKINYNAGDKALLGAGLACTINNLLFKPPIVSNNYFKNKFIKQSEKRSTPLANIAKGIAFMDLRDKLKSVAHQNSNMINLPSGVKTAEAAAEKGQSNNPFTIKSLINILGMAKFLPHHSAGM